MTATSAEGFTALFEPRGIVVAGVSSHPGKFGFVALHNILASGYTGAVRGINPQGGEVLGVPLLRSVDELEPGVADLVMVCTPASANIDLLRQCAAKGVRAAFIASGGYAEAGEEGAVAQAELTAVADELGMLVAGPNGQGLVSTPVRLCAQIVAPYPPPGSIGIASQSGNLVSSFMNWSSAAGVGVSRAVSAGNAAAVGVADFLGFYADDAATSVGLAYVESLPDGRAFFDRLATITPTMPVVLVKGGATDAGAHAAASHTGALASDDLVFDGACRQVGALRAQTPEEAFEAAATFATQPLPAGPNVVVMTTAGGWGVVAADAIARDRSLRLLPLPEELRAEIDTKLPRGGVAATRSTSPVGRPATRSRSCWSCWLRIPTCTPSCTWAWASSRTRPGSCGPGPSIPTTGWNGSSPTTRPRTRGSPPRRPRCRSARAPRSSPRPSWA